LYFSLSTCHLSSLKISASEKNKLRKHYGRRNIGKIPEKEVFDPFSSNEYTLQQQQYLTNTFCDKSTR
jgi:hypothetical protein